MRESSEVLCCTVRLAQCLDTHMSTLEVACLDHVLSQSRNDCGILKKLYNISGFVFFVQMLKQCSSDEVIWRLNGLTRIMKLSSLSQQQRMPASVSVITKRLEDKAQKQTQTHMLFLFAMQVYCKSPRKVSVQKQCSKRIGHLEKLQKFLEATPPKISMNDYLNI